MSLVAVAVPELGSPTLYADSYMGDGEGPPFACTKIWISDKRACAVVGVTDYHHLMCQMILEYDGPLTDPGFVGMWRSTLREEGAEREDWAECSWLAIEPGSAYHITGGGGVDRLSPGFFAIGSAGPEAMRHHRNNAPHLPVERTRWLAEVMPNDILLPIRQARYRSQGFAPRIEFSAPIE